MNGAGGKMQKAAGDLQKIAEELKKLRSAVIFTHTRPDGDTLGGGLALFLALSRCGVRCEICNDSDIPDKFFFLKGIENIKKFPTEENAEAYIAVDSSEEARLGELGEFFSRAKGKRLTFNIDHHISNTLYARFNYVRQCAANCQNIAALIRLLGVETDKDIADALMTGLMTDSGNFSHSDVDGEVFRTAGLLADAGADVDTIGYNVFRRQSAARALLYGRTMSGIRYFLDGRFAVIVITREMLSASGADQSATEGFVDFPLSVDGVEVAAAMLEVNFRRFKISLRSKGKANVNAIAGVFGGGGHILASGCMMFGDAEEIIDKLRYTVSQHLD